MRENRAAPRFGPLVVKSEVDIDGVKTEAYLTNVSRSGGFIALPEPPPVGTELDLWALLPWRIGELRVSATVVWRSDGTRRSEGDVDVRGVGVSFNAIRPEADEMLERYLARFVELAEQLEHG